MATDILGRMQFNAPLPQTIYPTSEGIAKIIPESIILEPGMVATISAEFDPTKLRPGTNSFLLLAQINAGNSDSLSLVKGETPNGQSELSSTAISQYLAATIFMTAEAGSTIDLKLVNFDWNAIPIRFSLPDYFILTLKNDGNALATPRGLIRLTDLFGTEISRGTVNDKSSIVLPGAQRVIYGSTQKTRNPFFITPIKLQLNTYDSAHQSTIKLTKSFLYVSPWTALLIPILSLIFVVLKKLKSHS